MAQFIGGRKQGRKEPGALGGPIGTHGQPREEAQDSEAALQGLSGHGCTGGSMGQPPPLCWALTQCPPCTAPHGHSHLSSQGDACSQAGLEGCECLCRPENKAKGAVGLLWLFPERNGTCLEKLASAMQCQEQSVPLLCSTMSWQTQRQGVRTSSAVDQRALEPCHFLRHREKSQARMKKHWSHHFKGG